MKIIQLLENLEFHNPDPYAEPLLVNDTGRILRFTLRPGQSVKEHMAPHSPVYLVVLKGHGMFAGGERVERKLEPNTLLTFEPGELHQIRALDEELVVIAFLHEAPGSHA